MQEMCVQSLGGEDSVVEDIVITHLSILVWETPWSEEPGRLLSTGLQRAGLDWAIQHCLQTPYWIHTADTLTLNTHPSRNAPHKAYPAPICSIRDVAILTTFIVQYHTPGILSGAIMKQKHRHASSFSDQVKDTWLEEER